MANMGPVTFDVRVLPRSSRSEIVGMHDGALKVKLRSAPVEGAANDELIRLLAMAFEVPRSSVEIVSGQRTRAKRVRIVGADDRKIAEILQSKSQRDIFSTSQNRRKHDR